MRSILRATFSAPVTRVLYRHVVPLPVSFQTRVRVIEENPEFKFSIERDTNHTAESVSNGDEVPSTDPDKPFRLTLEEIPHMTQHFMRLEGRKLPVQVVIGRKGVDTGVLNCITLHFRRREMLKISVARMWKDNVADIAQQLEERSGGVVIERAGRRILLYRGGGPDTQPQRTPQSGENWWNQFKKE